MISKKLINAMNEQITNEQSASQSYLALAAWLNAQDLPVLGQFYFNQAEEERQHALKILHYLLDIDVEVKVGSVPEPKGSFKSVIDAVEHALKKEEETTQQIHKLVELADKEHDYPTRSFLKWYVDEQVEELATAREMLGLVKRAGEQHLLLVEDRLLKKGITPQSAAAEN